jgi:sugar transferase (PEP-CTERM/EpsH1 system associated)
MQQAIAKHEATTIDGRAFEGEARRLRVAHVVLSLDVGGLERNVINQVREGQALGQEISVVCVTQPGTLASQVESLGGRLFCLDKSPGIRLDTIGRIRDLFRALKPDIVHTHQIGTLIYAGPAAASLGKVRPRVVHTEHGREPYTISARRRWLGRLAGLFVERFFCLTQDMVGELNARRIVPKSKVRIIDNGIDIDRFRERGDPGALRRSLGISPDSPVIGSIGRLVDVKRQDVLIRAFAEVRRAAPDAHLVLVGGGPLEDELKALADRLDLETCVHIVGHQAEAWKFLYIMNCFALTSRSEGMPQAVLEAAIAGLPIVATRVGGLPELIDDGRTGILIEPNDPEVLTQALLAVLGDPDAARQMGHAARQRVESRFHVRRMAEVYHRHFLEILGRAKLDSIESSAP